MKIAVTVILFSSLSWSLVLAWYDRSDECVFYYVPVDTSLKRIHPRTPTVSDTTAKTCSSQLASATAKQSYVLMYGRHTNFTALETRLCGDNLVPLGLVNLAQGADEEELDAHYDSYRMRFQWYDGASHKMLTEAEYTAMRPTGDGWHAAINMTTGHVFMVNETHQFSCLLCQLKARVNIVSITDKTYTFVAPIDHDHVLKHDVELLIACDVTDEDDHVTTRMEEEIRALPGMAHHKCELVWGPRVLNSDGKRVIVVRLKIYVYMTYSNVFGRIAFRFVIGKSPFVLPSFSSVTVTDDFLLCFTIGDFFGSRPVIESYRPGVYDTSYVSFDPHSGDVTLLSCVQDFAIGRAVWQPPFNYTPIWRPCNYDDYFALSEIHIIYNTKMLHKYQNLPVVKSTVKKLLSKIHVLSYDTQSNIDGLTRFLFTNGMYSNIERLLGKYDIDQLDVDLVHGDWIRNMFFLANLNVVNPIIGAYHRNMGEKYELLRSDIFENHNFTSVISAVSVSKLLIHDFDRLAIFSYNITVESERYDINGGNGEYVIFDNTEFNNQNRILQIFTITLFKDSNSSLLSYADDVHHYVDFIFSVEHLPDYFSQLFASWDFETHSWSKDNCRLQKTTYYNNIVYRCKHLFVDGNQLHGYYIMYNSLQYNSDIFSLSKTLKIILAVEVVLSLFGVLSIFATAILFREWRQDLGHQIMLQMTFALLLNLVLGFTNSLFRLDITSTPCVVVGALRHYSFLSMFLWMLTLSYLQYRRLTTIAGAKTTSHLLLKISLFAWGLPLLPLVILLAWDYKSFYMTRTVDRGYCYPDGIALIVTVEAPAIIVLALNLLCFIYILNNIYKCVGSGPDIKRHGMNERKAQLRNLATSIFVFFLFGFSWLFNLLSETEVIKNQTVFDYLFLVTATFHVFMLSLFFVFLEEKTMGYWMNGFRVVLGCEQEQREAASGDARSAKLKAVTAVIVAQKRAEIRARVAKNTRAAASRAAWRNAANITQGADSSHVADHAQDMGLQS